MRLWDWAVAAYGATWVADHPGTVITTGSFVGLVPVPPQAAVVEGEIAGLPPQALLHVGDDARMDVQASLDAGWAAATVLATVEKAWGEKKVEVAWVTMTPSGASRASMFR